MDADTIFHQSETHAASDLRRAKELRVVTALTLTGEAAVFIAGKGIRLLLPAEQALRVAHEVTVHLAHAKELTHTRYRTYTLDEIGGEHGEG